MARSIIRGEPGESLNMKRFVKKRYLIPLIVILLIAISLAAVLIVKARSYLATLNDPGVFSEILSHELGCPVTVGKVKMSLAGRLTLYEISATSPESKAGNHEFLFIPRLEIHFNLWKTFRSPGIECADSVEVVEPRLILESGLIDWLKKRFEERQLARGKIPTIAIKSGSLKLALERSNWTFQRIQGKIAKKGDAFTYGLKGSSDDLSERWDIKGDYQSGGAAVSSQEGPGSTEAANKSGGTGSVKLFVNDLNLASYGEMFGETEPVEGRVMLEAESSDLSNWKGTVKSKGITARKTRVTKLSAAFTSAKDNLEISALSFDLYDGKFQGSGKATLSKDSQALQISGSFSDISSTKALSKDIPLKGKVSGTVEVKGSGKKLMAGGTFGIGKGSYSETRFQSVQGGFSYTPSLISLKKVVAVTGDGQFTIDGAVKGKTFEMKISCPSFTGKESLKDLCDVTLPPEGGVLKCYVKGTVDAFTAMVDAQLTSIRFGSRDLTNVRIKGTINVDRQNYSFEGLELLIGDRHFPLFGSITKGKETHIILEKLSAGILEPLTGLPIEKYLSTEGMTLDVVEKEKSLSGEITAGKGHIRDYPFSGMKIEIHQASGGATTFSGNVAGKEPIRISGKSEHEVTELSASASRFEMKGIALQSPLLSIIIKEGKTSGELAAKLMSLGKDNVDSPRIKFEEKAKESYELTGALAWNKNPFAITGTMNSKATDLTLVCEKFKTESLQTGSGDTKPGGDGDKKSPASGDKKPPAGDGRDKAGSGDGHFSGVASVKVKAHFAGNEKSYAINLASSDLAYGDRKFPPLEASISTQDDKIVFNSLVLKTKEGALTLTGSMKDDALYLESSLKEQSLDSLSSLMEKESSSGGVRGRLTGKLILKGSPTNLSYSFNGAGANMFIKDLKLGSGSLSLSGTGKAFSGTFAPQQPDMLIASLMKSSGKGELSELMGHGWSKMSITFSEKDKNTMSLKGSASHEALGSVTFEGEVAEKTWDMTLHTQKLGLKSIAMVEPEIHLTCDGDKMKGNLKSREGKTSNDTLGSPSFSFEELEGGAMSFSGSFQLKGSEATVTGKTEGDSMDMVVKIPECNIKTLTGDKLKDDKLSGTAQVEATLHEGLEKTSRFSIDSSSLSWGDKKLPRISVEGEEKKGLVLVSALKVYIGQEKPLYFTGNISPEKQSCVLNGRIEGTSIPLLVDLIGGNCADIQGNLQGALAVEGSFKDPEFRYEGRMLNLVYQGKNMGDGKLNVSGTKSKVDGRLDLDNPPKYKAGISSANVEMSYYFTIGGTPKDLVIKPQTASTKLNVSPSLIWQLFQGR